MAKSPLRDKPDTSKWFLTDRPMSVLELVAELRREPHPEALLSRTAREWLRHRDVKPSRRSLPAVRRQPSPWRARVPKSVEILDCLWPQRQGRLADFLDQLAQAWCLLDKRPKAYKRTPPK
jgi:hypothetical protein